MRAVVHTLPIIASLVTSSVLLNGVALAAEPFTIIDAITQAVKTNPGVGEASANRRATQAEMHQVQSTLLPQVRLLGEVGRDKFDRGISPEPLGNDQWLNSRKGSVVVRQLLFDGFSTINDIWRQAARVDAAASRVMERTELIALDAAEAYIDVTRYMRIVTISQENVGNHKRLLTNVRARYEGGRAGEGDLQQAEERVAATEAVLAEFRQRVDEARARYRRAVGLEPYNVRFPGRLGGLPASKDESLAVALRHNPTIRAAGADAEAAKYGFHSTAGAFVPNVSLEGRATTGRNYDFDLGNRDEISGKVVVSWDIFRGGQDSWRRTELAERYAEQSSRHARLQRDAFESLDKAWAARTITVDRIAALNRQIEADRRVIVAYTKEYELGQRTLIDLLTAENQLFNALVAMVSTRGVAVFADYQLLAAMGKLLEYLKAPLPLEADPLPVRPLGVFPAAVPPILVTLPSPGPEPLNVNGAAIGYPAIFAPMFGPLVSPVPHLIPVPAVATASQWTSFAERWHEPKQDSEFTAAQKALGLSARADSETIRPTATEAADTNVTNTASVKVESPQVRERDLLLSPTPSDSASGLLPPPPATQRSATRASTPKIREPMSLQNAAVGSKPARVIREAQASQPMSILPEAND